MKGLTSYDFFGMNEKELLKALSTEKKKTKEMADDATKELHKWAQQAITYSIKPPKTPSGVQFVGDTRASLIAAINEEQRKQKEILNTISSIKSGNLSANQIKDLNLVHETSNIGARKGEDAHDKYSRVMEMLSDQAADLRATWDSTDVLKIDDIAIQKSISYEQAKAEIEKQNAEGEEIPEDV